MTQFKKYENNSNKIIRNLLSHKNISFKEFTVLFNKYTKEVEKNEEEIPLQVLNTKLSRNSFKASFFIKCLHVLDTDIQSILNSEIIQQIKDLKTVKIKNEDEKKEIFLLGDAFKLSNIDEIYYLILEKPFKEYEEGDILIYEKRNIYSKEKYLFNFFNEITELEVEDIQGDEITIEKKVYKKEIVNNLLLGKLLYGMKNHTKKD